MKRYCDRRTLRSMPPNRRVAMAIACIRTSWKPGWSTRRQRLSAMQPPQASKLVIEPVDQLLAQAQPFYRILTQQTRRLQQQGFTQKLAGDHAVGIQRTVARADQGTIGQLCQEIG